MLLRHEVKGLTNKLYTYALAWKKTSLHAKFQVRRCFEMDLVCIVMYCQDTKERGYNSKCIQVNEKICNLEREYRDCIKSRRDKIGITRHIMMHQVLYNVHVTLFIGQLHNI